MSQTNTVLGDKDVRKYLKWYLRNRGWDVELSHEEHSNKQIAELQVKCEKRIRRFWIFRKQVEMYLRIVEMTPGQAYVREFALESDIGHLEPQFMLHMHEYGLETMNDLVITNKVYWRITLALGFKALFEAYDEMAADLGHPQLFRLRKDKH